MTEQADDVEAGIVNPLFVELIRSQIQASGGAITFDRYMELVLYHPQFGYYTQPRKRIGKEGDFITSVSIGRCFGKLLARHLASAVSRLAGSSGDLLLVEPGAEDGHLALDVMHELEQLLPEVVYKRLCYVAIEPFPSKRQHLMDVFGDLDARHFRVVSGLQEIEASRGVLVANEVLDAMPVKRLRWRNGKWLQICVANGQEKSSGFQEVESVIEDPELARIIGTFPLALEDGFTIELNMGLKEWFQDLAQAFDMLYCCLIDYGLCGDEVFSPARKAGTLRGYLRHHVHACPFSAPGITDLTAHVDFDRVQSSASAAGFDLKGFTDQHRFLVRAAKPWLLEIEKAGPLDEETRKLLQEFQTLSHPTMMGGVFKVLEMSKGVPADMS
jgi:SAM-dependent MidA family methyltransferase